MCGMMASWTVSKDVYLLIANLAVAKWLPNGLHCMYAKRSKLGSRTLTRTLAKSHCFCSQHEPQLAAVCPGAQPVKASSKSLNPFLQVAFRCLVSINQSSSVQMEAVPNDSLLQGVPGCYEPLEHFYVVDSNSNNYKTCGSNASHCNSGLLNLRNAIHPAVSQQAA